MARRIAFYSHDAQGLGHVRRNIELAGALTTVDQNTSALLISGATAAPGLALPPRTELVTIPPIVKEADGSYRPSDPDRSLPETLTARGQAIGTALDRFGPDLLVVDKHPRGLKGELEPVLTRLQEWRSGTSAPAAVLGLRDILDDPASAAEHWLSDAADTAVRRWYDQIWVYGDHRILDPGSAYNFAPDVAARIRFTGYLARGRGWASPAPRTLSQPYVLGMVGGGQDGAQLAHAFVHAPIPVGHLAALVTGPYLDPAISQRLRQVAACRPELILLGSVPQTRSLTQHASAVVTMGGYNSVCEVLASGSPGLIVPRTRPRQEQQVRAQLLAPHSSLDVMLPHRATPDRIGAWLRVAVQRTHDPCALDLDGLARISAMTDALLSRAHGSSPPPFQNAPSTPASHRTETTHVPA
ncbi:MAG: glycosyltransferase family protein [Propioniciclava sp.]